MTLRLGTSTQGTEGKLTKRCQERQGTEMSPAHFAAVLCSVAHDQALQVGFIPSVIGGKETRQKEEDFPMPGLVLVGTGLNP